MSKLSSDQYFYLSNNQWLSVYLNVRPNGKVVLESDDRHEQIFERLGEWTWQEFYGRYKDSTEKPYREAAALIASLSE